MTSLSLLSSPLARCWGGCTVLGALLTFSAAAPLLAQYPLTPNPVLNLGRLEDIDLGGYLSVREALRNDSSTFAVNRARVTVATAPVPFLGLRIQGDLSAIGRTSSDSSVPSFVLTDAYAQLVPPDSEGVLGVLRPVLIVGQFKTPFSLEYNTSFSLLRTANRSLVVDQISPRRDIGVFGQVSASRYLMLAGAVVNGSGSNAPQNTDGRQLVLGRLTLLPLPDLAIAAKVANEGGEHLWGYDARWMQGPVIIEGEWMRQTQPADLAEDVVDARGGYVLGAVKLLSWLQPVVKWERFREGATAPVRSTWTTIGVNLLSPRESLRVQVNWIDKEEDPVDEENDELNVQVVAIY